MKAIIAIFLLISCSAIGQSNPQSPRNKVCMKNNRLHYWNGESWVALADSTGLNFLAPNGNGSALTGLSADQVGLANVTNESKTTMFTNPTFTGNAVLGTPASGNFGSGTFTWPTFNQNTTGTASNVTGTVAIANGGTGSTSAINARTALGLAIGTDVQGYDTDLGIYAGITPSANVQTLLATANYSAFRTAAGLSIGTDVQAYDADLTAIASVTATTDNFLVSVSSAWASRTPAQVKATLALDNVTNESKATMLANAALTGATTAAAVTATGFVGSTGTAGVGYTTGAGGTVTQATSKSTGVTLNKTCGQITMNNAALTAGSEVVFTLTNSTIAAADVVIVNIQSVGTAGSYLVSVSSVSNGSCTITLSNASAGSLSQALVLSFAVIKAVTN